MSAKCILIHCTRGKSSFLQILMLKKKLPNILFSCLKNLFSCKLKARPERNAISFWKETQWLNLKWWSVWILRWWWWSCSVCCGILQTPPLKITFHSARATVARTKPGKTDHWHGAGAAGGVRMVKGNNDRMSLISINLSGLAPKSCWRKKPRVSFAALHHKRPVFSHCCSHSLTVSLTFMTPAWQCIHIILHTRTENAHKLLHTNKHRLGN